MKQLFHLILATSLLLSCSSNNRRANYDQNEESSYSEESNYSSYSEEVEDDETEEVYPDGTYCAEVDYYNPNSGTNSTYTLKVEVESNEVTQINWPNEGWMDNDHFSGAELDEDGYTSFTSDKGYDYEIEITGEADDCFIDVPQAYQCSGITEDGDECENMTDNSNRLCWQHQDQE